MAPIFPLLAAGASLAGQVMTNQQNSANTASANRMNYRIFQEQNQYNLDQWQRNNEYNTPKNQRLRYEEAGINPYLALSNITPGMSQASTSASANAMQAPQISNPIDNAVNAYNSTMSQDIANKNVEVAIKSLEADINKKNADTAGVLENNQYIAERQKSDIANINANTSKLLAEAESINAKRQLEVTQLQEQIKAMRVSSEYQSIQSDIAKWSRDIYNPQQAQLLATQMADINASIRLKGAELNLTKTQAWNIYEQTYKTIAEKQGIQVNNNYLKKIQPYLMQGIKFDNEGKVIGNEYMQGKAGRENTALFISLLGAMNK